MMLPIAIAATSINKILVKQLDINECSLLLTQDDLFSPNDLIAWLENTSCDVVAIHTPMMVGGTYTNIEDALLFKSYFTSILDTAEAIGVYLNKVIPLVFHTRLTYDYLDCVQPIACYIDKELTTRPHIDICVENGVFRYSLGEPFTRIPENIPLVVNEFNKWLSTPAHTCLNIFNANEVTRICDILINNGVQNCAKIKLEDFMSRQGNECSVVYISQCPPVIAYKQDAGIGFGQSPTSVKLLSQYVKLCKELLPNANLVINVYDEDTLNRPELKKTVTTMREYL